ncbi:MAG TPA: DUF2905 domain-containing protein [Chthoniobacterales bacterium]
MVNPIHGATLDLHRWQTGAQCRVQEMAKLIVGVGVVVVVIGLVLWKVPGAFWWVGRLPGDFSVRKEHFSFYFPVATCLVISVVLTLLSWLLRR